MNVLSEKRRSVVLQKRSEWYLCHAMCPFEEFVPLRWDDSEVGSKKDMELVAICVRVRVILFLQWLEHEGKRLSEEKILVEPLLTDRAEKVETTAHVVVSESVGRISRRFRAVAKRNARSISGGGLGELHQLHTPS